MAFRVPMPPRLAPAFDREEAIDRAVKPYRDALRMIQAEAACGQELIVAPDVALAEIDRVAESALRGGGVR